MEESIHNHVPMIFLYLKTTTEVKCFVLCSCFLKYTCCALYGLNQSSVEVGQIEREGDHRSDRDL